MLPRLPRRLHRELRDVAGRAHWERSVPGVPTRRQTTKYHTTRKQSRPKQPTGGDDVLKVCLHLCRRHRPPVTLVNDIASNCWGILSFLRSHMPILYLMMFQSMHLQPLQRPTLYMMSQRVHTQPIQRPTILKRGWCDSTLVAFCSPATLSLLSSGSACSTLSLNCPFTTTMQYPIRCYSLDRICFQRLHRSPTAQSVSLLVQCFHSEFSDCIARPSLFHTEQGW